MPFPPFREVIKSTQRVKRRTQEIRLICVNPRPSAVGLSLCAALLRVAIVRLEFSQDKRCSPAFALIIDLIKGMTDQMQP
jgi:hypothetical protein